MVDGKAKAIESSRVELRAGGVFHRPEKPGWSAGDMEKQPGNEMKNNNNKMKFKNEMKNNDKMKNKNEQQQKPPWSIQE